MALRTSAPAPAEDCAEDHSTDVGQVVDARYRRAQEQIHTRYHEQAAQLLLSLFAKGLAVQVEYAISVPIKPKSRRWPLPTRLRCQTRRTPGCRPGR